MSGFGETGWDGATLFRSIDNGSTWDAVAGNSLASAWGTATVAPTDFDNRDHNVFQEIVDGGTMTVVMRDRGSSLASATESDILSIGANLAVMIAPTGEVEMFYFQTVTNPQGETYILDRLLRGQRGTEDIASNQVIVAGSTFIVVETDSIQPFTNELAKLNAPLIYRAVTSGHAISDAVEVVHTDTGRDRRPYSPTHLHAQAELLEG